jgi:hypothetical protein
LNRAEAVSLLPEPGLPERSAQAETTALDALVREAGAVVVAKEAQDERI